MSILKARRIVREFKPHIAIGTGGYASGPLMWAATRYGIPALLQEQNSYAGLTNKQLAGKVKTICVAYPGMENYFPQEKLVLTGNPVRKDILQLENKKENAYKHFGLDPAVKTLLVLGGSGGARTINESILAGLEKFMAAGIQMIWQTGKFYFPTVKSQTEGRDLKRIHVYDFLKEMDLAYAAAHVVISRAGALSISELCLAKKPVVLIPSPNVAEDHQTKNAAALVKENAALMIADKDAVASLAGTALDLLNNSDRCEQLSVNIARLGKPLAAEAIVDEIEKLIA